MIFGRWTQVAVVSALVCLPAVALMAQDSDIIAKREAAMKSIGKDMGAVKALLTGPAANLPDVKQHAANIAAVAKSIPAMFPAGSDKGETYALPVVWSDQAGFEQAAARLEQLAAKLGDSADTGDAKQVAAAFAAVGKEGCSGCHQTYRKPES